MPHPPPRGDSKAEKSIVGHIVVNGRPTTDDVADTFPIVTRARTGENHVYFT